MRLYPRQSQRLRPAGRAQWRWHWREHRGRQAEARAALVAEGLLTSCRCCLHQSRSQAPPPCVADIEPPPLPHPSPQARANFRANFCALFRPGLDLRQFPNGCFEHVLHVG